MRHRIHRVGLAVMAAAGYVAATQPIARWDVVPGQRFDAPFKAGVVAFHEAGVEVAFSVDGEAHETVTAPSLNDRTGVVEYWIERDPSAYADGPLAVTAVVVPGGSGHTPRTLDTLELWANAGGTYTNSEVRWVDCDNGDDNTGDGTEGAPYQSIRKAFGEVGSGGTVYLKPGTAYDIADGSGGFPSYQHWTTIRPAPGVSRDQVVVRANRTDNGMMRYQCFTVHTGPDWGTVFYGGMDYERLWADSLEITDVRGKTAGNAGISHYATVTYVTDCYIHDFPNGPGCELVRHVLLENLLSDAVSGAKLAIDVTVDGIDPDTTGAHPDVYQLYSGSDTLRNRIVYNLRAYDVISQGLFNGGTPIEDIAFVNILIHKHPSTVMYTQFSGYLRHILFWHVSLDNQTFLWRDGTDARDVYVQNCILQQMGDGSAGGVDDRTFTHNHFVDTSSYGARVFGTDITAGPPLYEDPGARSYLLQQGSPARGTGTVLPCVPADMDGVSYGNDPNRGAYADHDAGVHPGRSGRLRSSRVRVYPTGGRPCLVVEQTASLQRVRILDMAGAVVHDVAPGRGVRAVGLGDGDGLTGGAYVVEVRSSNGERLVIPVTVAR